MSLTNIGNDNYMDSFKQALNEAEKSFSWLEKRNLYFIYTSICVLKIEKGKELYKREVLETYKKMLALRIYTETEGGSFHPLLFRNIVAAGIFTKEYGWLKSFIDNYSPELNPAYRSNMLNLSSALLNFELKRYDPALENLSRINFEAFIYKVDVKFLMLKAYYELNLFDSVLNAVDSFKHFISNDRFMSERMKYVYFNFSNIVYKLAKLRESGKLEKLSKIQLEIDKLSNKINTEWLKEKATQLKSS